MSFAVIGGTEVADEFGFTTWGADLVRVAEPISAVKPNSSAPRARMIARNGGVTVTVDEGRVQASVHTGAQASVTHLEFAPMDSAAAEAARRIMGSRTEPDDATHRALMEKGFAPAPALVQMDCSCRSRTAMCVHVLATIYALAARVNLEPTLALTLQSVDSSSRGRGDDPTRAPVRWIPVSALQVRDYFTRTPSS